MARPIPPLNLTQEPSELLHSLVRCREVPHSLVQRAQIILKAANGLNNKTISQELALSHDTVGLWRQRWVRGSAGLNQLADKPKKLRAAVGHLLADKPRLGRPCQFSAEQICQIIGLACETPPIHLSHWSYKDLLREVLQRNLVKTISKTTIGRFLKSGRSQAAP